MAGHRCRFRSSTWAGPAVFRADSFSFGDWASRSVVSHVSSLRTVATDSGARSANRRSNALAGTVTCCARRRLGLAAPGADWTVAIDQVLSSGCFAGSFRRSRVETAPRLVVRGEGRCWEAAPRSVVGERGALEEKRSVYCQRVHASVAGLQPRSRQPPRSGRNDQPGARIYPRSTGLENAGADAAASSAARKKPTWQNTLRRSATSAYSTPNLSGPPEVLCVQSPDESDQRRIVRDFRKKASGDF